MGDARFDAWTRRRFGLVASGAMAALLGLTPRGSVGKKRCKRLREPCNPERRQCCRRSRCRKVGKEGFLCCRPVGESCRATRQCCSDDRGPVACFNDRCELL
jgi:hypothetical protein